MAFSVCYIMRNSKRLKGISDLSFWSQMPLVSDEKRTADWDQQDLEYQLSPAEPLPISGWVEDRSVVVDIPHVDSDWSCVGVRPICGLNVERVRLSCCPIQTFHQHDVSRNFTENINGYENTKMNCGVKKFFISLDVCVLMPKTFLGFFSFFFFRKEVTSCVSKCSSDYSQFKGGFLFLFTSEFSLLQQRKVSCLTLSLL